MDPHWKEIDAKENNKYSLPIPIPQREALVNVSKILSAQILEIEIESWIVRKLDDRRGGGLQTSGKNDLSRLVFALGKKTETLPGGERGGW